MIKLSLPEGGDGDADSLAVGLLELAHLGGLLHPEVDFVGVLADNLARMKNEEKERDIL